MSEARDRKAPPQTRARARACEADNAIMVRRIWPAEYRRRTPMVLVEVELAGARLTFGVVMLKGQRRMVRPPLAPDGESEGVWLHEAQRERVVATILDSVAADPTAVAALHRRG